MNQIKSGYKWLQKHEFLLALLIAVCFITITLALGYYSNKVIPGNVDPNARYLAEPSTHLDFMSEWDGPHYIEIAQHGYLPHSGLTAFFPLYPLLVHLFIYIFRSPLISALIVSWTALTGAIYFYLKILKQLLGLNISTRIRGLLLFLFFPTGVFLAATYTESLFAFLSLGAIYFAINRSYIWAGIFTGLDTACHPNGVFIIPLVALLLFESKISIKKIITAMALGCTGIVGYITYLWSTEGKPFDFITAQRNNHWLSAGFVSTILNSLTPISLILYILVIISVFYWWKRKFSLAAYSLFFALLPILGGNFAGYSRYALMAFPLQFMLIDKLRKNQLAYPILLLLFSLGWTYFVIHYAAGYTGGS